MLKIEKKLDMFAGAVPVVVYVSQYDSDFEIEFSLYSSQDAFTIESGTTAQVRGTKKDGNGYSVDATLSGNKVTVAGDQQMTACAGEQYFELTLHKGEKELNTCNFILSVERAALDKDTLPSKSVIRELVNVIDRTDEIIAAAQQADDAVEQAADLVAQTEANATRAEEAADTAETAYENALGKVQEILDSNAATDALSLEALAKATNAENEMAGLGNNVDALGRRVGAMELAQEGYVDDGFVENGVAYFTHNGTVLFEITGIGGGGGGGGQGGNNAKLTVTNKSGFLSKTIADGAGCAVSVEWSSIEDEMPTGDGTLRITVNGGVRESRQIQQGEVTVEIAKYCNVGSNVVKVTVEDVYGNSRTISFSITVIALSISSSFDAYTPVTGSFSFPYTPVGAVQKTIHFLVDGNEIGTQTTAVSGRQMSYAIPAQSHGAHTLTVYFEAEINGETVQSNTLYYDMICLVAGNHDTVIASPFKTTEAEQYTSLIIPFTVYDPDKLTAEVTISVNNEVVSTQTVDRTQQSYTYRADAVGTLSIKIESGEASKTFTVAITESQIDVHAETQDLVLHLTSQGRSNAEAHPEVWEDGAIKANLTGFNFTSDGWQKDADGITVLRVAGDARVTIPYKAFAQDFRTTGKTIEVEFAARDILDYDAVVLSCMSGGRGLQLTSQVATLRSEQSSISTQYKEDEHVTVSFVVEKRNENRLIYIAINGINSGVIQYPADDDFSQMNPVGISIGAAGCTTDIYHIRVYDNDLTRYQILNNWIADTQSGIEMKRRYDHNNIYDEYGQIVISKLPKDLPYFILNAEELPQYKGDKKTISGSYVDPEHPAKSFTFSGCQINVQGTSSAPYARKNYDMQFKQGFEMNGGSHEDNYALAPTVIPFNRFVLKADVASSEGANNVELVKLYNDATPFKRREQKDDPKVRQGIYGFPIVVFWNDTVNNVTSFLGKYNFNLPKRAPAPYGYSGNMESWEFQNNTSDLMLFKTDYFDQTMVTDPTTGDAKEAWRYDYEARFPSDEWVNFAKLQELETFVVSCDRSKATGNALAESVTYGGVTYTNDTAEYRLARFRNEFGKYAEVSSFIFYYIFTELFLMVDSRAKNLFIGFSGSDATGTTAIDRKAVAEPYDMDTAIGTNNEGFLVFGYSLEDVDHLSDDADVFNGQESVLWNNVRDAFPAEIVTMYQTLRSTGVLSYATVEKRFEDHQAKWSESIFNEDAYFKYITPLTDPDPGKEPTDFYLPMLQGSKAEQRKWWLFNRFRYMDSKWNAGDALAEVIQLRGYAKADITVTPYADIYPTVKYASYLVSQRGQHGVPATLRCPLDNVNDTEIYIYSASQIASAGDLSGLKVRVADFSKATKIQSIIVGSAASGYDNPNLETLSVPASTLLSLVDVRNCSNYTGTLDLSAASNIEEVYLDGTKVTAVTLPVGGVLRKLHLPNTVTNLTIRNQSRITDLTVGGYTNISTLRIENSSVDSEAILRAVPAGTRVRLIGFAWEAENYAEIEALCDLLDTMRGLDEQGGNMDTAQVSGTIHTGTLTGAQIAAVRERYPYLTLTADHTSAVLTYKTFDGSSVIGSEDVLDGGNGTLTNSTARAQDAQYTYSPDGWATEPNGNKNADALKNVVMDRTVYAAYSKTLRSYTVTWVKASADGGGTLQTKTYTYGTTVNAASAYTGSTPTTSQGSATDYPFEGWEPASATVQGDTTFTAKFGDQLRPTITDTWPEILAAEQDGTYKTKYSIGDTVLIDLGTRGEYLFEIADFDSDPLADGSGNAPITWVAKRLLNLSIKYADSNAAWSSSNVRTKVSETYMTWFPTEVQEAIKEVYKYTDVYSSAGTKVANNRTTDKMFILSAQEIFGSGHETSGKQYSVFVNRTAEQRIRKNKSGTYSISWLRTGASKTSAYILGASGGLSTNSITNSQGILLGFCT